MAIDNVTSIQKNQISVPNSTLTVNEVIAAFKYWRANKKRRNEKIPAHLWDMVFILLEIDPLFNVLPSLTLTKEQFEIEKAARQTTVADDFIASDLQETQTVEFCEAKNTTSSAKTPLAHKPAKAFSTTTAVVELYRPDGMLMKIHICTDRFEELLSAFFKG